MRALLMGMVLLFSIGGAFGQVEAQTVTAFKTGERTTGMTKQCSYHFGSSEYTRTVRNIDLCPFSIQVAIAPATPSAPRPPAPPTGGTVTAFRTGERTTGMTKQCYYRFASAEYTRTVQSISLCPLSIQVRR